MPAVMGSPLAISPTARLSALHFGAERQPLIVIDGALPDPQAVVAIAAKHRFEPIGPFYPGVRATVSEAVAMGLVAPLRNVLVDAFSLPHPPEYSECFLSVVTTPPEALAPIQRLPHFDGFARETIAVLLYLDVRERGGTAFYRQRGTGFESVDETRFERFRQTLEAGIALHGLPQPDYLRGNTPLYEQIHEVEGLFNRMIAYRGNTLHCGALVPGFVPVANPAEGRLTLNLFLGAPVTDT